MAVRPDGPSEFDGPRQRNGTYPSVTPVGTPGHTEHTATEQLSMIYRTGQTEDLTRNPDDGQAFTGLTEDPIIPEPAPYFER